jgi:hypothetical protein
MATEYEEQFAEWLVDAVHVQRFLGPGPQGPVLTDPELVTGLMLNYGQRLVKASETEERMSDARITGGLPIAEKFPPESIVTLPDGQKRTVLQRQIDPPQVPLAHVRVVLV